MMALYKYIGKQSLSFVHNGIPSYLSEGMVIKPRLIDYVMKKYPQWVKEVTDSIHTPPPQPPQPPQPPPTIQPEPTPVPVVETTLVDFVNTLESPTLDETYDILYSIHSSDNVSNEDEEISNEVIQKFDVSILTTYERVLELYKNELIDLCKQLELETSGRKSALVDRVCLKLGISIK